MLIRVETLADWQGIEALLQQDDPTGKRANWVARLRENGQTTLSLVAFNDEGQLVGHVFVSPLWVENEDRNWQVALPLTANSPAVSSALLYQVMEDLGELGYPRVFWWGDPNLWAETGATIWGSEPIFMPEAQTLPLLSLSLDGSEATGGESIALCPEFSC